MHLGELEWKTNGKKAHKLHGVFPYQPVVQEKKFGHGNAAQTLIVVLMNGHPIKGGFDTINEAKVYAEDWVFSTCKQLAQTLAFRQHERINAEAARVGV